MVVTFFISSNPKRTARKLDNRRLGKQRVEAKQIIDALEGKTKGWNNHPCTRSWIGYTDALKDYCNIMIKEWIKRGKNNTMKLYKLEEEPEYPPWASCKKVHYSHQARLIQKDPNFYTDKFSPPEECLTLGYIWPYKWTAKQLAKLSAEELSEPYVEELHCNAVQKNGKKCASKARFGNKCGTHKPKNYVVPICSASFANGKHCTYKAKEKGLCGVHRKK
jgi:hypothetical protein